MGWFTFHLLRLTLPSSSPAHTYAPADASLNRSLGTFSLPRISFARVDLDLGLFFDLLPLHHRSRALVFTARLPNQT